MGSVEVVVPTIVVNTTTDEVNSDGDCSLREAIKAANTNAAVDACLTGSAVGTDIITLPAGTYALTITGINDALGLTGDLDIFDDLTINGAGAATTIIDGNGLGDRIFDIFGNNIGTGVTISGVTLQNGEAGEPSVGSGGAIFTDRNLTILDSAFLGNEAGAFGGGAIRSAQGGGPTPTLTVKRTPLLGIVP